jgi:hypothetical protein
MISQLLAEQPLVVLEVRVLAVELSPSHGVGQAQVEMRPMPRRLPCHVVDRVNRLVVDSTVLPQR